jgi:glycosyl transferase family 87
MVEARHRWLTPERLRRHLSVLVVLLWVVAIIDAATPTWRLRTGQVKGTDFVHFYTLARVGLEGKAGGFADLEAQRAFQLAARPESRDDWYPPAYGPQVAALLAPLGFLSYGAALIAWLAITSVLYVASVRAVGAHCRHLAAYTSLLILGAAAFPAFWELILHGQLSAIALVAVVAAWFALRAGHAALAGAALGILGYKLSLVLPVLAILLLTGSWTMLGAAMAVTVGQAVVGAWVSGPGSLQAYAQMVVDSPRLLSTLAAKPYQMHSWRAFWLLIWPARLPSIVLYVVCGGATALLAAAVWRRTADPSMRMSALVIATVLCAPHLYVYDLVILAPVWMWLTDRYLAVPALPGIVGWTLYVGYAAPLLSPIVARFAHVQLSVICLAALLWFLWRLNWSEATSDRGSPSADAVAR